MTEIQDYLLGLETGSLSILPSVDGGQKLPKVMALFEPVLISYECTGISPFTVVKMRPHPAAHPH